jgi:hypothetical protein
VPGVQKIVVLDDLVAVVGDHMWAAKKGLDALKIDWDGGPHGQVSSNDIWEQLWAANEKDGVVARSDGDIAKGLATGERFEASYELPFLAPRRWNRSTPRFTSSPTPAKSGPARRSWRACSRKRRKPPGFQSKK